MTESHHGSSPPQSEIPDGDIVVVIPGILGSVLHRGDRQVWGYRQIGRNLRRLGDRLTDDLTLGDVAFTDEERGHDDGVRATSLLGTQAIIPGFVSVQGYDVLVRQLRQKLRASTAEVLEFPYDWRQSNRVSARYLKAMIDPIMKARRATHPNAGAVLVGHSMGGLVARYYAELLDDHGYTKQVITVGTPYMGAAKALEVLANGHMKLGPKKFELEQLLRSLPSAAELLPAYECIGPHPVDGDSSVPNLDALRPESTYGGLPTTNLKHGLSFHKNLNDAAAGRADRDLYRATLGYLQPTAVWASMDGDEIVTHSPNRLADRGDGTVPVRSARPPEWSDASKATAPSIGRHASLQQTPEIIRQLVFLITTGRAPVTKAADDELSVTMAGSHVVQGETWTIEAESHEGSDRLALELRLYAEPDDDDSEDRPVSAPSRVEEVEPLDVVTLRAVPGHVGRYRASLPIRSEGLLRWEVVSAPGTSNRVDPISDLVLCTDED